MASYKRGKEKRGTGKLEGGWEARLAERLTVAGLPPPKLEYKFHPKRKWRFDIAYPEINLAIEVEGGMYGKPVFCHQCKERVMIRTSTGRMIQVFAGGRHTRPGGYEKDIEKYNTAAMMGWVLIRVTPAMIRSGEAVKTIVEAYNVCTDSKYNQKH